MLLPPPPSTTTTSTTPNVCSQWWILILPTLASSAGSYIRASFSYSGFRLAVHTAGNFKQKMGRSSFISCRGPSSSPQENKESPMELHAKEAMPTPFQAFSIFDNFDFKSCPQIVYGHPPSHDVSSRTQRLPLSALTCSQCGFMQENNARQYGNSAGHHAGLHDK